MKIRSVRTRSVAALVRGTLAFFLISLAVLPVIATDTTSQGSSSSESKSVPLWRRGISTWNGTGYLVFPNDLESQTDAAQVRPRIAEDIQRPYESKASSDSSKPYSVPTDPSLRIDSAKSSGISPDPGVQLPGIRFNPLVVGDQSSMAMDGETGLSKNVSPIISVPSKNQSVARIPGFRPITDTSEFELSADSEAYGGSEIAQISDDASIGTGPTITQHIQAGVAVEPPPLREEAMRWYQYPWRWIRSGWTNHAELGLDGSNGNADTLAIQTGLELKRKTDDETFALDLDYRYANSQSVTTEQNGRLNLDYDRLIGDTRWSYFGKFGMEWDTFKAFDLRLNFNGGLGYHWIRNDRTTLVHRFGAGASKEIGSPDDSWIPEAVFGLDGEHRINKYHKVKGKVDYFPSWEDYSDYRIVTDLAWEILLDDEDNLSLKLAVTDRYDSTPQGAKPNDLYYSLLLLVKF